MQNGHGKKNRNHGVDVAENCNRLRAQRLHAAKVQGVSKARVEHAENQQAGKRDRLEGFRREALARKRAVGHHHERRSEQLDNRFIVGADLLELFVAEDDACIQAGSAESQRNAGQLPRFRDSPADDARDQNHAAERGKNADSLFDTQLFAEKHCRCQRQECRLHVIAERCHGNRRVPVRLKQQRPVEPHDAAGEQQNSEVFPDGRKIQVLTAHGKKQQQKHRSEQASRQRNQPGAERDVAHEQADRTENAQRRNQLEL